jgi:hypothetical protein
MHPVRYRRLTRVRLHTPAPFRHNRGGESARFVIDHHYNDRCACVRAPHTSRARVHSNTRRSEHADNDTVYCVTSTSALAPLVVLRLVLNRSGATVRSVLQVRRVTVAYACVCVVV